MEVIREYENKEHVFDNTKSDQTVTKISMNKESIRVDYRSIIDTQFSGGNLSNNEFEQLKGYLALGTYSNAPCGGFINFHQVVSNKGNRYVIYSGVNEVSNSHYVVTIHKILASAMMGHET